MIAYVSGILSDVSEGSITVETGGMGFNIFLPATAFSELPAVGAELKIFTYFSVSEDSETLYGFLEKDDREIFKNLIRVNGIGPKAALNILSVMNADELRMAVATGDTRAIARAQGIGVKTAERVILDLKDRIGLPASDYAHAYAESSPLTPGAMRRTAQAEAIEALNALGYTKVEAARAVGRVPVAPDMSTEEILRLALKNIRAD